MEIGKYDFFTFSQNLRFVEPLMNTPNRQQFEKSKNIQRPRTKKTSAVMSNNFLLVAGAPEHFRWIFGN